MMLTSDLVNVRAVARRIRPAVEHKIGSKVGLETIAVSLHREINKLTGLSLDSLLAAPRVRLLTTYHDLVAVNYPKGVTGLETIPDTVRFFAQTTGSNEHTIIISRENRNLLDTARQMRAISGLSALCLGLPPDSSDIESLYAGIFLFFGSHGVSIAEVVSTFNELTLVIKTEDYDIAYQVVKDIR
jgi:hypothetical protein